MIRPLRVRHRRWIVALAVLLPAGLVGALAVRPQPPADQTLPAALDPAPEPGLEGRPIAGWSDLWRGATLTTRVTLSPGGELRLDLVPHAPVTAPDLLVYWSPGPVGEPVAGAPLPPDAHLLGGLDGTAGARRLPLPGQARAGGRLILFSLAWGETVAAAELPPLPGAAPGRGRSLSTMPSPASPGAAP